jgi:hypothetical protein
MAGQLRRRAARSIEWAQIFPATPVPDAGLHRQAASLRVLLAS